MKYIKFLFALLGVLTSEAFSDPLIVELPNGKLRGRDNGGYYSYESIPYAEPPLGEFRFEAPRPYSRQWPEIFDATHPPVFCIQWNQFVAQSDKIIGSEDCLTVNVYKPKNISRKTFPVVALIHGGAFMFGGAAEHGHERFMDAGNFILVKISYRLGPMGFLSTGDAEVSGNFGLKDQRLALQWIKANIDRFGGEPDNVLLMGHSAGDASVHLQLLHEDFNRLAKVAFSMSGNALSPWAVKRSGRRNAFHLGRIVGCGLLNDSQDLKKCLKAKEASHVVGAVRFFQVVDYMPLSPFGPVVESSNATDAFLTQHPRSIIESGKYAQVPWLTSYTKEDGGFCVAGLFAQQSAGKEAIEQLNHRWYELAPLFFSYRESFNSIAEMDNRSRVLREQYLGNRSLNYWDLQRMFTDVLFKNDTEIAVDLHRKHGKSPVYAFVYDNPDDIALGSVHCDDFFLLFENSLREPIHRVDEVISKKLIKMLEGFVERGTVIYDNCVFASNVDQKQLQLVAIKRDRCDDLLVDHFP